MAGSSIRTNWQRPLGRLLQAADIRVAGSQLLRHHRPAVPVSEIAAAPDRLQTKDSRRRLDRHDLRIFPRETLSVLCRTLPGKVSFALIRLTGPFSNNHFIHLCVGTLYARIESLS